MKHIRFISLLSVSVLALVLLSCNRDEIFEREQYKAVVALLSDDNFNIFAEELPFSEEYLDGYIAASCGGVLPITEPIKIDIEEDKGLLDRYNTSNFSTEAERYALYLDKGKYTIETPGITIPAGGRSGRMKISLKTEGLSPDSVYFIPFRVKSFSAYEFNPKKNTVLYRLYLKNDYASTKDGDGSTVYNHLGKILDPDSAIINSMVQKEVFPTAHNQVRIMAGIEPFKKEEALIEKWSILLTVNDGKVTITPWNTTKSGMEVWQVDDNVDYPNTFSIVNDGFNTYKTFLLCYRYSNPNDGRLYYVQEELRLAFNKRDEQ
jgi:hypothetical protein